MTGGTALHEDVGRNRSNVKRLPACCSHMLSHGTARQIACKVQIVHRYKKIDIIKVRAAPGGAQVTLVLATIYNGCS